MLSRRAIQRTWRISRATGRSLQVHESYRSILSPLSALVNRSFASGAADKDKEEQKAHRKGIDFKTLRTLPRSVDQAKAWFGAARHAVPQLVVPAGLVVAAYGVSKIVIALTSYMMHMNFTSVVSIGFGAGFLSASVVAGGAFMAWRRYTLRPEPVYRMALHRVKNSQIVQDTLGKEIVSGTLRAYTLRDGHIGFDERDKLAWLAPRVQMLFQVQGGKGEGMVSVEALKKRGQIFFTLLAVDAIPAGTHSGSKMLFLDGLEERLKVRGQLRGFLQTERVRYIEQTRVETESERMKQEQEMP